MTNILRDNPDNEGVQHYVAAIRRMRIPKDPVFWGTVREAYEVVLSHGDIQPELKQQLRQVLQKKGAKWAE
ncbi:hypothetical protein JZ785_09865 [Alicyclobacillus curvatus]|nr:hypothetical protein JZ785_09865 [Alicyclobacillus curvatus]